MSLCLNWPEKEGLEKVRIEVVNSILCVSGTIGHDKLANPLIIMQKFTRIETIKSLS